MTRQFTSSNPRAPSPTAALSALLAADPFGQHRFTD
jgi:hypothetical protein